MDDSGYADRLLRPLAQSVALNILGKYPYHQSYVHITDIVLLFCFWDGVGRRVCY